MRPVAGPPSPEGGSRSARTPAHRAGCGIPGQSPREARTGFAQALLFLSVLLRCFLLLFQCYRKREGGVNVLVFPRGWNEDDGVTYLGVPLVTTVSHSSSAEAARRSTARFSSRITSIAVWCSRRALSYAVARARARPLGDTYVSLGACAARSTD